MRIDGVDARDLDLGAFRRQLGVVPQEAFLFTGTVRDNIAYGRPDATDAESRELPPRAVGAHDFVASLPHGYYEPVSERGRSLSSGQRQLIALARARLVDPAILLLDEATSQLDLESEARVQQRHAGCGARVAPRSSWLIGCPRPDGPIASWSSTRGGSSRKARTTSSLARDGAYASLWATFATAAGRGEPQLN